MKRNIFFIGLFACFLGTQMGFASEDGRDRRDKDEEVKFRCFFQGAQYSKDAMQCWASGEFENREKEHGPSATDWDNHRGREHLTVACNNQIIYDNGLL